jgi:inner membrane transporter RhtA
VAGFVDRRAGASACFVIGAVSQYVGASIAVKVFDRLDAVGVAWLRVASAAVLLLLWRRPRWRQWTAGRWRLVAAFGVALAAMNLCFYLAIRRLPLGTAVAIEFSGPIAVAALGVRRGRNVAALALAVVGVVLLADVRWEASPAGVGFALAAAALWAGYIVGGSRVGGLAGPETADGRSGRSGLDGLAAASLVGALAIAPVGVPALGGVTVAVVAACAVVGLLSNVVPYALDQLVFPRLAPSHFALLSTLLPATAAVTGAVVLGQFPTAVEAVGIGLVIAAVAITDR